MNIPASERDSVTSGILLLDKPTGLTSHDVVNSVRRKFGFKKVGHAGTLDPMATGLLILLIGSATKRSYDFLVSDKTYLTVIQLGLETDTGDIYGNIIKKSSLKPDIKDIKKAALKLCGKIEQIPPMFSAKRHKGKKLYELARKGIIVERKPRSVYIHEFIINKCEFPDVHAEISCSKGTYIRQLAMDMGNSLKCGAHLTMLRRIKCGDMDVKDAVPFFEVVSMKKSELKNKLIL